METQYYKEALLTEKERVLSNFSAAKKEAGEDFGGDEVDKAAQINNNQMAHRFIERDRSYLVKVERALAKIEEGTYGLCEECEDEIGEKRLKIRPTTTLCISCKEDQEHREKIYARG